MQFADLAEEFELSATDLGSMSLSLSLSMVSEEEVVQDVDGEVRLRGAAERDAIKAIS